MTVKKSVGEYIPAQQHFTAVAACEGLVVALGSDGVVYVMNNLAHEAWRRLPAHPESSEGEVHQKRHGLDVQRVLHDVIMNDETKFRHHQARTWDGKKPTELPAGERGTCFKTPRQIAEAALKEAGLPLPYRVDGER